MIPYASCTANRRNIATLRAAGWRLFVTPAVLRKNGLPGGMQFAIDNGAFGEGGFQEVQFGALVDRLGCAADFVVLPDIVAGGKSSLDLSVSWISRLRGLKLLLLPIQDGLTARDVGLVLRQNVQVGLFMGGTTAFKLRELYAWGMVAHAWKRYYHVGRVNTARRIRLCEEAGADSFDGSGPSRFSSEVAVLDHARKQPSLLAPAALEL
jgi:hypothetical protein